MIRTYTMTYMISESKLPEATFSLDIYKNTKYEDNSPIRRITYNGVKSWSIIEGGDEALEIEQYTDESGIDENHEYLVLNFIDGTSSTYRNSYVDLFIR